MDDIYSALSEYERKLQEELKKIIRKNDVTPADVQMAKEVICLLLKMREYTEGRSYFDGEESRRSYRRMPRISYNRGRDSMNSRSYSRDGSYENGNSRHSITDRMVDRLESMMDETGSQYERDTISEWIDYLRNS